MTSRRVLILSASSGDGHVRAGKALEKAFTTRGDPIVEHIDALDYTSKPFRKLCDDAYIALVRRAPGILGCFFDHIDRPWQIVAITGKATEIRRRLENLAARAGMIEDARMKLNVVGYPEEMDQLNQQSRPAIGPSSGTLEEGSVEWRATLC